MTPIVCAGCGALVTPGRNSGRPRKWCSGSCRVKTFRRIHAVEVAPFSRVYFRECKECSILFASNRGAQRYCTVACRTAWFNRKRIDDGTVRRQVERRRVRKHHAGSEKIDKLVLAERDDWTCGICATAIPSEARYPNPLSLSVDHVEPLSLGGSHTYANTRATHLACNVKRGVKVA